MKTKEKILELISKENLTKEEKNFLLKSLTEEPELSKYKVIYNLLSDMKNRFHLDTELISEYVLYKNNLPLEDESLLKFIPEIEKHISQCSKCKKEFQLLNEEYSEIDNYLTRQFEKKEENLAKETTTLSAINFINSFAAKRVYAFAAVIAFFAISLFTVSQLTVPAYKNISELSALDDYSTTRGRMSPEFQNGLQALSQEDYEEAIKNFKNDVKNNFNDRTIFYTDYMLGLIYLKKSESDFLGLFTSFNKEDLEKSIIYFNDVVKKNNSGSFNNITYNAYFFLGKSYLLKDNFKEAKKYFQLVIDNRGSYSKKAEELLKSIEQNG